jgi:hypothetical protein
MKPCGRLIQVTTATGKLYKILLTYDTRTAMACGTFICNFASIESFKYFFMSTLSEINGESFWGKDVGEPFEQ